MSRNTLEDKDADAPETHATRLFGFLRSWGLAEFVLDQCVAIIMHDHDRRTPPRRFPVTLEKKLEYVREALAEIPALLWLGPHYAEIDAGFMREKDLRNTIVHGAPLQYEENGTVHFLQLRPHKSRPSYKYREVKPADWDRLETFCIEQFVELFVLLTALENMGREAGLRHDEQTSRERVVKLSGRFPLPKRVRELMQEALTRFAQH